MLFYISIEPQGEWVSFHELGKAAETTFPFFQKRCEIPMKRVADAYTDLFDDLVHFFIGRKVDELFQSDISVVLYPFPKVPIMICYWKPDDGLDSSLNVYFDKSAKDNIGMGAILTICAGLAIMFERISARHEAFIA